MTVSKLGDYALKIYMDRSDIEKYDLDFDKINSRSVGNVLFDLCDEIAEKLSIDPESQRLYVEVFSRKDSCLMFVSVCGSKRRAGKKRNEFICQFESFEELENFCRTVFLLYPKYVGKSTLYSGQSSIRLYLKLRGESDGIRNIASIYGVVIPFDRINKAVTEEHFDIIAPTGAIEKILAL